VQSVHSPFIASPYLSLSAPIVFGFYIPKFFNDEETDHPTAILIFQGQAPNLYDVQENQVVEQRILSATGK
jgi:hypothetical protein